MADRPKLLRFTQRVYQDMGIRPSQSNQNWRSLINWRRILVLSSFIQMFIFSLAFLILEAETIVDAGKCFYTTDTLLWSLIFYLIQMWKMPKIRELIGNFEQFIDERIQKSNTSIKYKELIDNIEKMSEMFHFAFVKMSLVGFTSSAVTITAINYFLLHLDDESYYMPSPVSWPFDWKTPLGYALALFGFFAGTYVSIMANTPLISFMIGSCWLIVTFIKDIANDLSGLNAGKRQEINRQTLEERFCNIVRQFCEIKEFINDFNNIYEFLVFSYFAWSLLSISSVLFVLLSTASKPNPNPIEIMIPTTLAIWSFFLIFFICQCGEFVMDQFDDFDDALYQSNWYLFPIKMQKMLVIVIMNVQKPATIHGFDDTLCTRDAFKTTIKAAFSYFMTIQRIAG